MAPTPVAGKGGVKGSAGLLFPFTEVLSKDFPAVFVIVAINTQVLPVRSIGRVIQMISIFVVDGQEVPGLFIKFSAALGTDETMDFERPFSIITPRRLGFL